MDECFWINASQWCAWQKVVLFCFNNNKNDNNNYKPQKSNIWPLLRSRVSSLERTDRIGAAAKLRGQLIVCTHCTETVKDFTKTKQGRYERRPARQSPVTLYCSAHTPRLTCLNDWKKPDSCLAATEGTDFVSVGSLDYYIPPQPGKVLTCWTGFNWFDSHEKEPPVDLIESLKHVPSHEDQSVVQESWFLLRAATVFTQPNSR